MLVNRRTTERFAVLPAYTPCRIRLQSEEIFRYDGHVHDLSEGGVRFESDIPIEPGTPVALQIALPERVSDFTVIDGPGRDVFMLGNVVWCSIDEPGPALMAVATTRFARAGDRDRLIRRLLAGGFARMTA